MGDSQQQTNAFHLFQHHLGDNMKTSIGLLFSSLILLFSSSAFSADPTSPVITNLGEAINQAGRQRMLTQRIVKAYTQQLLDIAPLKSEQEVDSALKLFNQQLNNLSTYAPSFAANEQIKRLKHLWKPFEQAASIKQDPKQLKKLVQLNEELLAEAHQLVLILEGLSKTPKGYLVNIAGRQRMLSQRIAKFYLLRAYGTDNTAIKNELAIAASEFLAAMT